MHEGEHLYLKLLAIRAKYYGFWGFFRRAGMIQPEMEREELELAETVSRVIGILQENTFALSLSKGLTERKSIGKTTAPTTTGPHKHPRPTSSTPQT